MFYSKLDKKTVKAYWNWNDFDTNLVSFIILTVVDRTRESLHDFYNKSVNNLVLLPIYEWI